MLTYEERILVARAALGYPPGWGFSFLAGENIPRIELLRLVDPTRYAACG